MGVFLFWPSCNGYRMRVILPTAVSGEHPDSVCMNCPIQGTSLDSLELGVLAVYIITLLCMDLGLILQCRSFCGLWVPRLVAPGASWVIHIIATPRIQGLLSSLTEYGGSERCSSV